MMCYKTEEDPLYEAARKYPITAKRFMSWTEEAIKEFILSERRIMKNDDSIESLITSTITHIVIALDNDKPGDAKVYAEALVLLKQAQTISSPNWTYSKPFEKISDPYKHNPNV